MSSIISELKPFRWKCFQVLVVENENDSSGSSSKLDPRKRNAKRLLISDRQYEAFCDRHKHVASFVPESNGTMASSYLILDEYLCFLDKGSSVETQSPSILDVGFVRRSDMFGGIKTPFSDVVEYTIGASCPVQMECAALSVWKILSFEYVPSRPAFKRVVFAVAFATSLLRFFDGHRTIRLRHNPVR